MRYRIANIAQVAVSLLLLLIGITVFAFSYRNYIKADQKIIRFDAQTVDAAYIGVNDNYGQENSPSLSDFFSEPNSLERMKEFNQFLNKQFDFILFQMQPLLTQGEMPYRDEFRIDYGQEFYGVNDQFGYSLKSVQMNKNAYYTWKIADMIDSGKGFAEENFTQDKPLHVPTILGYEYKGLVSIGDMYPIEYYGKIITLEIIGFFQKDVSIPFLNDIYYLDDCILLPSYQVNYAESSEEDAYLQKVLLSQQNWGYIKIENGADYYDYQTEIEEKSAELDMLYVTNEAYASEYIQAVSSTLNSTKGAFLLISFLLFLFLSIITLYILVWEYNNNKKSYAIHLACGASFMRIKSRIFGKIFLLFFTAFLGAARINYLLFGYEQLSRESMTLMKQTINFSAIMTSCTLLLICIVLNIYVNKNNVYTNIQEGAD